MTSEGGKEEAGIKHIKETSSVNRGLGSDEVIPKLKQFFSPLLLRQTSS